MASQILTSDLSTSSNSQILTPDFSTASQILTPVCSLKKRIMTVFFFQQKRVLLIMYFLVSTFDSTVFLEAIYAS